MNKQEAIKAVNRAKKVFAYVKFSDDLGCYVELKKSDVLAHLNKLEDEMSDWIIKGSNQNLYIG